MATHLIAATPQEQTTAREFSPAIPAVRATQGAGVGSAVIELPLRRGHDLFAEALLEMSSTRPKRRISDVLMSVLAHVFVLVAVILPSLYFTDSIDLKKFSQTFLVGPPPPPPPAPVAQAAPKVVPPKRVLMSTGKLLAPVAIPQKVVILKEEMPTPDIGAGVAGGVPGGVPGGQMGGVIGGIISGTASTFVPAPVAAPRVPIRVGGRIKAPRLLVQFPPAYPTLARQTRLQGEVFIDAVIDPHGNVVEMHAVSGHPLLIPAALAAVSQWKYEPTYLNDIAISVELAVKVNFQLNRDN